MDFQEDGFPSIKTDIKKLEQTGSRFSIIGMIGFEAVLDEMEEGLDLVDCQKDGI